MGGRGKGEVQPRRSVGVKVDDMEWQDRARCRGLSDEAIERLFFPGVGCSVGETRAFCAECPVSQECLEWAIKQPSPITQGIYAGTNEKDRRAIRRRLKRRAS